jgi:hypothetical protein
MKKIGAVVTFFILLFAFAKWGQAVNFNTTTQPKGEPFIVSGERKVSVTPDIAKVTIGIQENGSSLKTVQNSVNAKSKNLTDTIKKLGVAESDIKTVSYNVYPQYDYNDSVQKITGYQVSTNYEVKVKDFDKVNDVLTAATSSGANTVGAISFEVNEETKSKKLQEAREKAVSVAKEKAQGLAKAAGIALGKVINVSESQSGNEIRPMYATKDMAVGSGTSPVPANIQPGETDITVTISLSYEVR